MEKAYENIDAEECRKMLHLDAGELEKYAQEKEWAFEKNGKKISFLPSEKRLQEAIRGQKSTGSWVIEATDFRTEVRSDL